MNQPGTSEVKESKKQISMLHLKIYNKQDILSLTRIRRFETKLGERLQVIQDTSDIAGSLKTSNAKYVLFGVPEDLGAKGNYGIGGTDTLWIPFLQSFLNIQAMIFLME
jgi:formiminoglutamase